ncbi:MAG: FecR domain-containing protein [Gammaproteobacteria bacterium]
MRAKSLRLGMLLMLVAIALLPITDHAAIDLAGTVTQISGNVTAQLQGQVARNLREGDVVYAGEEIRTAGDSSVKMKLQDNTQFALGADSRMRIAQYRYRNNPATDILQTQIYKGIFRFVSGLIAKKRQQSMTVVTSVATIGIRGTHVIGEVTETSATIALMEPEEAGKQTAIEVSNQYGSVVIDKPRFETVIPDAHSPPSPPRPVATQRIDNMLRSIQTIRRVVVPRLPPRLPN